MREGREGRKRNYEVEGYKARAEEFATPGSKMVGSREKQKS
jgi:hypothetical protein